MDFERGNGLSDIAQNAKKARLKMKEETTKHLSVKLGGALEYLL